MSEPDSVTASVATCDALTVVPPTESNAAMLLRMAVISGTEREHQVILDAQDQVEQLATDTSVHLS